MPKNNKSNAPATEASNDVQIVPTPLDSGGQVQTVTQLTVQNESMVAIGIAARETELESAIAAADVALKPLIAARADLTTEIDKLVRDEVPNYAEAAARPKAETVVAAFSAVNKVVKATVTPSSHRPDGSALARVSITETNGGYQHIDFEAPYTLPAELVKLFADATALDARIGAGRTHQVQLKAMLGNLSRDERRIRATLGAYALRQTEQGRELLIEIQGSLPAIPELPAALQLTNG